MVIIIYRTAGNIGGQLNLAVWQLWKRPSNLSAIYVCACTHIICTELPLNLNPPIFLFRTLRTKPPNLKIANISGYMTLLEEDTMRCTQDSHLPHNNWEQTYIHTKWGGHKIQYCKIQYCMSGNEDYIKSFSQLTSHVRAESVDNSWLLFDCSTATAVVYLVYVWLMNILIPVAYGFGTKTSAS